MLFTSITQFVVLGLLVFIGWLFGFASHPGGKRWREAYEEEAVARAQDREELDHQLRHVDSRIAELEREKAELAAELETAKASRTSTIAPAAAGAAVGAVAATAARPTYAEPAPVPVVQPAPEPVPAPPAPEVVFHHPHAQTPAPAAEPVAPAVEPVPPMPTPAPEPVKRGWFDWGKSDDLTRLRGIDDTLERKLKDEKVDTFREIAELSDQDEIALERRLDLPAGFIQREEWRQQARLLAEGDTDTHAAHYGDRGDPVRPLPLS